MGIERPLRADDGAGGWTTTWTEEMTWASVEQLTGKEAYRYGRLASGEMYKVVIRYRAVDTGCRVRLGTRHLDVLSVIDEHQEHRRLELICAEKQL